MAQDKYAALYGNVTSDRKFSQKFLKIGVIGLGGRIDGFLKWCFVDEVEDFAVTAITDINIEQTQNRIKESPKVYDQSARIYTDADEMLDNEELDGVFVGTRAPLHVEMAVKVMKRGIPLFLEKPVAIEYEDLIKLNEARKKYNPKCLVSFPLRESPMTKTAKEIIESGRLGKIEHVQAYNDIPYGRVYVHTQYRNPKDSGGLWLEKASHDLDVINYLMGEKADKLCAMQTHNIFRGDKPIELKCAECPDRMKCPESDYTVKNIYRDDVIGDLCSFSKENHVEDCGTAIIKYKSGAHAMYAQNTFARFAAGRRGGRYYGYKGTLEIDLNAHEITIMMHDFDRTEKYKFDGIKDPHNGGDQILAKKFAAMMRGEKIESTLLDGIESAMLGVIARESCEKEEYIKVPSCE